MLRVRLYPEPDLNQILIFSSHAEAKAFSFVILYCFHDILCSDNFS